VFLLGEAHWNPQLNVVQVSRLTNVFGGAITVRPNLRLPLGRSSGTLSAWPKVILEIPIRLPLQLPPGGKGWSLRGVRAANDFLRGTPSRVQIATLSGKDGVHVPTTFSDWENEHMEDNTLVESSFSATINAPIEQVDIPSWCFSLPESEYQACSGPLLRRRDYDS